MKRCRECGEEFEPRENWPWNTFCSEYCLLEWWHEKERQEPSGDLEPEEEDDE